MLVAFTATRPVFGQTASPTPFTAPPAADAGPGQHFGLDAALTLMEQSHPLLASARSTVRAASADITAAGLWTNPTLDISHTRSLGYTSYDPGLGYTQLTVSQLLETAGLPIARRRVAEALYAASRSDADGVRLGLAYAVRSAFVSLAAAYARLLVLQETALDLGRADDVVRARVAAGAAPQYDASRIGVALADALAAVSEAQADIIAARVTLDVAVGPRADELHGEPDVDLSVGESLRSLAAMADQMVHTRPDLVAARHRVVSAGGQVDVARRSVFQGITVSAGAALGASVDTSNVPQMDLSVGVGLPLPILDRGQGTIPAAELRADAARAQYDALVLAARQQLAGYYDTARERQEAVTRYVATGVAGSAGMRAEAEVGYREGHIQILDLVDAYTSYRDARLRLLGLATAARAAEVDLRRAVEAPPAN